MFVRTLLISSLALSLASPSTQAQCSALAADINTNGTAVSAFPMGFPSAPEHKSGDSAFTKAGAFWYFRAQSLDAGWELFRTDGTPAGTQMVVDIEPGAGSSSPSGLVEFQGQLFFAARTSATGRELWKTDGTALGTVMVKDLGPGAADGVQDQFAVLGGKLLFPGNNGTSGWELWSSDGSAAGTTLVKDIRVGGGGSGPVELKINAAGSTLLFFANDAAHGNELWKSDGTTAGTQLLKDIHPGSESTTAASIHFAAGLGFFAASVGATGTELWITDETGAGTQLLMDFDTGYMQNGLSAYEFSLYSTEFGGKLYFPVNSSAVHEGLWVSDGTVQGTLPIFANTGEATVSARFMTESAGTLYLTVWTATTGSEVWKLVGNQIVLMADLQPGGGSGVQGEELFPFGQGVLFTGALNGFNYEPFFSGPGGTGLLLDIEPGSAASSPSEFTLLGPSKAIFAAKNSAVGRELWVTDGTTAGTGLFKDVEPAKITNDSSAGQLHGVAGQSLLLSADDGQHGTEPWSWDPVNGITLLADINPGIWPSFPSHFTSAWVAGHADTFFVADSFTQGKELWHTDCTPAGTSIVLDLAPGPTDGILDKPLAFNDFVYFLARGGPGPGLWKTDGTPTGTSQVKALPGAGTSPEPRSLALFQNELYFAANDGVNGMELWKSDGTTAGTQLVLDINPSGDSSPEQFTEVAGKLVFSASTPASGTELWITDGTAAGTQLLADAFPGPSSSMPGELTSRGDTLLFAATNAALGRELWTSDLTTSTPLIDIKPGSGSSSPSSLIWANGKLFFSAIDAMHGRELWTSDGTAGGTHLVVDLRAGPSSGLTPWFSPDRPLFTPTSTGIYFTGNDSVHGEELFFSDGTAAGTTLVCDLDAGSASGRPLQLTFAAGHLFCQATTSVVGTELFEIFDTRALSVELGLGGSGPRLLATSPALGTTLKVSGTNEQAGMFGLLLVSTPPPSPAALLTLPGSISWIEPATFWIADSYPSGAIDSQLPIPASPALTSLELNLQAWFLPSGSTPALTSNGLRLVLGD